jgi:drug/metabolite transporter (DMT)-like permease
MAEATTLGIVASLFFAFTFVLNRQMNVAGGSWAWSASLRFIFMLPILAAMTIARKELTRVVAEIARKPMQWLLWSMVGFGLFYSSLCLASTYGPSWLIAATWQITIIAGALLSPLFVDGSRTQPGGASVRHRVPLRALLMSTVILAGILLVQFQEARRVSPRDSLIGVGLVVVAAFAYPLGNRKMMELCGKRLSTIQRVFGMTLCSMPLWIVLSAVGIGLRRPPSEAQMFQAFLVAVFSGIVATLLFFRATDLVSSSVHSLAVVESTQAGELVFTLLGGVLVFGDRAPSPIGYAGLSLVVLGMIANSLSGSAEEVGN